MVEDSGYPAQSSTSTLNIRVCSCEAGGSLLTCSAEAIFLPVGLSTGALMAILLCVALLIGKHLYSYAGHVFISEIKFQILFIVLTAVNYHSFEMIWIAQVLSLVFYFLFPSNVSVSWAIADKNEE